MSSRETKELCSELDKIESKFSQFETKLENNLTQSSTILSEIQSISTKFITALKLLTDNHPMYETNIQPPQDNDNDNDKDFLPTKLTNITPSIKTDVLNIKNTSELIMTALTSGKIIICTYSGEYVSFNINKVNGSIEDVYKKEIPDTKIIDIVNYDNTHFLIVSNDKFIYLWEHSNGKLSNNASSVFSTEDYNYGIALLDRSMFVCCNETFIRNYNIIDNKLGDKRELKSDSPFTNFTCEAILKVTNKFANDNDKYKLIVSIKYSNRPEDDGQLLVLNENKTTKMNVPGVFVTAGCYKGMIEIPKWNCLAVAFVKYQKDVVKENKIILLSLTKFVKIKEIDLGKKEIKSLCKFVRFKDNMFFVSNGVLTQFYENGNMNQFSQTATQLQGHGLEFVDNGKLLLCPYHEETKSGKSTTHKYGISVYKTSFE